MKRVSLILLLGVLFCAGRVWAEGDDPPPAEHHEEAPAAEHHEEAPAAEHHEAAVDGEHHEAAADGEHHAEGEHADGEHHAEGEHANGEHHDADHAGATATTDDADEDDAHYSKFDLDGDGKDDPALEKEYEDAMGGIKPEIDEAAVDKELAARPEDKELVPSISAEQFRKIVAVVRKVVLARMEKKMAKSSAKKMGQFSMGIAMFSLAGLLLLLIPFVYNKKYPGQFKTLMKYSALAAATFFITVNLFGGVLFGMKTAQGVLGATTNPSLAIARGTFDTLDKNAEDYIVMGKELFVPTLEQLQGNSEEQPSVLILENGKKIVKSADVFVAIAKMFKKVDFIFKILPIVLFGVTMILFGLAIKPTLIEIIRLPMRAASGEASAGRDVTRGALMRVWGELRASLCTIAVLAALTLISGFVLGQIVGPAIEALLAYFSFAVSYLQFVAGAKAGLVFLALFGAVLFLVLNLATLILSMSFFLGKFQKICQAKFNRQVPIATHARFFKWGIPSVLLVQVFPWVFVVLAAKCLNLINDKILTGVTDADQVSWGKLMLAGPAFLVVGFIALFWAARGLKAIQFLFGYKVP